MVRSRRTYCEGPHPDKGEVGGSSPPRPTIQITSKYAEILTFCLSSDLPLKTDLPKICQKSDRRIRPLTMGFRSDQTSLNILRETGAQKYLGVKSKSLQRVCWQKDSLQPWRWSCATRRKGRYKKAKPRISPERALIYEGLALLCTDRRFG